MPRVKLTFVALVALLGIFALAGCQEQPNLAASVGDVSLTNDEVDAAVAKIEANIDANGGKLPASQFGSVRQTVVLLTVFNEVSRRYAQEKGVSVPPPDLAGAAQSASLAPDNPYVPLLARTLSYLDALLANATPATPTEADVRAAYDRYAAQSSGNVVDYETAKAQFAGDPDLRRAVGLRNELVTAANRYDLIVNPRYTPLELPLSALVTLPLGDQGSGAVRDLS